MTSEEGLRSSSYRFLAFFCFVTGVFLADSWRDALDRSRIDGSEEYPHHRL